MNQTGMNEIMEVSVQQNGMLHTHHMALRDVLKGPEGISHDSYFKAFGKAMVFLIESQEREIKDKLKDDVKMAVCCGPMNALESRIDAIFEV